MRAQRSSDNTLRPCVYSIPMLPRKSIHNELISSLLAGATDHAQAILMRATPDTFTEPIDGTGRTVAHYAAYVKVSRGTVWSSF